MSIERAMRHLSTALLRANALHGKVATDILVGDCLDTLRLLPDACVQCVVTSPPYYGLRSYLPDDHPDKAREIGLDETPDAYIARLVTVFAEVRRVLRPDGTLWLNIGDTYAANRKEQVSPTKWKGLPQGQGMRVPPGMKAKDRMMIPAMTALALRSAGWWLRDEIVWHKPRALPYPAQDRTVSAHEMVYLLSRSERYFFDWAAIEEPASTAGRVVKNVRGAAGIVPGEHTKYAGREVTVRETRRARSVWSIGPEPCKEAHFAVMPSTLAERCILAGSKPGDLVLDPFGGAGTTALAAMRNGRSAIICELSADFAEIARKRLAP